MTTTTNPEGTTMTTTTTTRAPRCACPNDECRHGSREARADAAQARVTTRHDADRASGGYREATANDVRLARAASIAAPVTGGRVRRDQIAALAACGDASEADKYALQTGTNEAGTIIRGRAASALVVRVGCPTCPVREACLAYAIACEPDVNLAIGFAGGMGARARHQWADANRDAVAAILAPLTTATDDDDDDADPAREIARRARIAAKEAAMREADDAARLAFALRHRRKQ